MISNHFLIFIKGFFIFKGDWVKIISWNTNGIQARKRDKSLCNLIKKETPDILCVQEIRTANVPRLEGYSVCINPYSKYSNFYGTAIFTKVCPISIRNGFGDEEFDSEGRVINFEFDDFNLYNVYAPTGTGSKAKFDRKTRFYDKFTDYFKKSKKPVIVCGDFNRMAAKIDAKRPDLMKNKSGFKEEEQEWFKDILTEYIDAFRYFHEEGDHYTWWKDEELKSKNMGIRLDYFLVSKSLEKTLDASYILAHLRKKDHVPIVLELDLNKK